MKNLAGAVLTISLMSSITLYGQKNKSLQVSSPNGVITVNIEAGNKLEWSIKHNGQRVLAPSAIGLQLENGEVLGDDPKVTSSKMEKVKKEITAINYKKATIPDEYNQLTIRLTGILVFSSVPIMMALPTAYSPPEKQIWLLKMKR